MITNVSPTGSFITVYKYQEQHGENVVVGLTNGADSAINWAMMKMAEEERVKQLAETHPAVADAVAAVKKAEEQLAVVAALVK